MNLVTVLTFNEPEQTQALKQRLEAAGIRVHLHDERNQHRYRYLAETVAGVHLQVERCQWEQAKQLLDEWDAREGALRTAVHCPQCGSSRVEFPQVTRKFIMPSVYALLCALGVCEKKFYCEACHHTWPLHPRRETATDALGWPVQGSGKAGPERDKRVRP